jgi:hypothetical protein
MKIPPLSSKIHPEQVAPFEAKHKHLVVTLKPGDNIATFISERVADWGIIQHRLDTVLRPGDLVTLVSNDGLVIYDSCMVTNAEAGRVWLGKPLRIVSREVQTQLFSDGRYEVVPVGTRYGVRDIKNDRVDGDLYSSVEQAKHEILRRQPKQVA